ncbi:MAG: hypothetical protein A2W17_09865 [Planctomycetes bacterium RBG_16_41_13]|nr:MAG: hypothetical protein A2W17_09865 [Planctomycetes bacterium RBG_16_41_13]
MRTQMYKLYQIFFTLFSWLTFVFAWMLATFLSILLSMDTKNKEKVFNTMERVFSRISFKIIGMKVALEGLENIPKNEPVIFIANHQSMMDIKLSLAYIPVNFSFISKEAIFHVPVLGAYMTVSGHIPIKREEDRKAYTSLIKAINELTAKQKSLVIFPEGTRSEDGTLGTFKRGISLIVLKSKRRVIPMAISGSNRFMPKHGFLSYPENRNVKISFGKPLSFDNSRTDREYTIYVTNTLRNAVMELL